MSDEGGAPQRESLVDWIKRNTPEGEVLAKHTTIGIPSSGLARIEFTYCLSNLISRFGAMFPGENMAISMVYAVGSLLPQNRQRIVDGAMKNNASHVLFLDTDMTFPGELLHRLVEHEKPIIGVNYSSRREPFQPTAQDLEGNRVKSFGRTGIQKIGHLGFGAVLIEMRVFESLQQPWFAVPWYTQGDTGGYISEDVFFCLRARKAGWDVWVDHDLSNEIGHVGDFTYTHETLPPQETWTRASGVDMQEEIRESIG